MLLAEGTGSGELVTVSYGPHPWPFESTVDGQHRLRLFRAQVMLLVVAELLRLENHGDSLERAGAKA
jgi:hypothetical protein